MTAEPEPSVVRLYCPTGLAELALVEASGRLAWPPRMPEQRIFCPVQNEWYATKIAREWNVPNAGVGFMCEIDVDAE